jgi:hypothetical protein
VLACCDQYRSDPSRLSGRHAHLTNGLRPVVHVVHGDPRREACDEARRRRCPLRLVLQRGTLSLFSPPPGVFDAGEASDRVRASAKPASVAFARGSSNRPAKDTPRRVSGLPDASGERES